MDSIVGVMKKVAQKEVGRIYTMELGIVTSIFPHASDSDKENYQCSVILKNKKQADGSDFELRKVPVATQHMGLVNIPNVGDLVLVCFIGGNINAPVIIGRLYNDEDQPPKNKEKEFLLQHNLEKGGSLKIDSDGVVSISSQEEKSVVTVKEGVVNITNDKSKINMDGSKIIIENGKCTIKIEDGGMTIDTGNGKVTVKSMGNIAIGDAATAAVKVGGKAPAKAVADGDDIILSTHIHVGNLGAPCPILNPMDKINSIQAKARNTEVG